MKYVRIIAVMSVLFGLLYGCGAGGGGGSGSAIGARTATVTIQLQWPAAAGKATRAVPLDYSYATFEAFVGTQRIAFAQMTIPTTNVSMTLPLQPSAVTFYVNVYASSSGINLSTSGNGTSPKTGVYSPVVPTNPVLAHAVSTQIVSVGSPIVFTLNNTIASIVATSAATTTFALGSGPTLLENTVTAKDANGNTVLVSPRELIWQYAPTDTYGSLRGLITPTPPVTPPTPPIPPTDPDYTLTPLATGTVSLLVSDIQVNTGQVAIQSIVKYTITAPATPITLQLDPSSTTGTLLAQCPLYAGSVKLKLTEQALLPDPNDVPAPPINVTQAVNFVPATYTVTIPTVSLSYSYSGRPFVLTIDAYSGTNGSGALLAETTSSTIPGSEFLGSVANPLKFASGIYTYVPTLDTSVRSPNNFFLAADYKINGLAVTPATSSIYYLNSGQTAVGLPTTVALQAALTGTGIPSSQPVVIDPRTVKWSSSKAAATVSNSTGAAPTAGTVTSAPVGAATTVTITASDRGPLAGSGGAVAAGKATVTVNPTTGSGGLNIN